MGPATAPTLCCSEIIINSTKDRGVIETRRDLPRSSALPGMQPLCPSPVPSTFTILLFSPTSFAHVSHLYIIESNKEMAA